MPNVSIVALNEYLFETLDKLTNDDLQGEELEREIKRSDAVVSVAKGIIDNGALALKAIKYFSENGYEREVDDPKLLEQMF